MNGPSTVDLNEEMKHAARRDRTQHYKDKSERLHRERQLFLGLLLGLAIGALWEAIRQ